MSRESSPATLYLAHRGALVNYASRIVGDRAHAEDVVQEAYLRFDAVAEKRPLGEAVGYLYRIVRNAFPGYILTSNHHYGVFIRGETPLTARLVKPALIDAETGALTDTRDLPWYVTSLLVSQPLHFGDYGGMPMKIIWALLDLITIVVLGSGLYLWLARRRSPIEERIAALEREEAETASAAGRA